MSLRLPPHLSRALRTRSRSGGSRPTALPNPRTQTHRLFTNHPPEQARVGSARDWITLSTGLAGGTLAFYLYQNIPNPFTPLRLDSSETSTSISTSAQTLSSPTAEGTITAGELRRHKSEKSLWVAIDGDVWDVTDFVARHPGGSQILMDHGGMDVTKLFKGIHPAGTLENNLSERQKVGRLDHEGFEDISKIQDEEEVRIQQARDKLFGVDSVITIGDFEKYAKDLCPASAWEYYEGGSDSETSLRNNADAYSRVFFRPRIMRDVRVVDTSTKILGVDFVAPFYVSPTAHNGLGQPLGEVAVTRGAHAGGIMQVLSHVSSRSIDEVMEAAAEGQPIGYQLYMSPDRNKSAQDIKHAIELGANSIWLTTDTSVLGKRLAPLYGSAQRNPAPHDKPLTRGPASSLSGRHDANLSWDDITWIKQQAGPIPVVLKGVGAWEDIVIAKERGADAVVLSNHGGRQLDYAHAPLNTLHDLQRNAPTALRDPNFQVFVDGGIRRGTDIIKALCLGASAVGLGRPFIYAATGWRAEGVEKAIAILREEMEISMRLLGVTRLDQLGPEYLDCSKL